MTEFSDGLDEVAANERLLVKCDWIGHKVIPILATIFVASYWMLGLLKYYDPNLEFLENLHEWEIVPSFQVLDS